MITGIVDLYSGDGEWDLDVAARAGVVAVIHKATEGRTFTDKGLPHAVRCARMLSMRIGAYHFGRPHDVPGQVAHFLDVVGAAVAPIGDVGDLVLALDLEGDLDAPTTMTTEEAADFVARVRARTLRWPLLYAGASKLRERMRLASADVRTTLAQCPLWLATYGEEPKAPAPWADWSLWQYSDGKPEFGPRDQAAFPRSTPGFHRCDRNAFRGTVDELAAWWSSCGA